MVKNDWKSKGFSCDVWIDSPGQEWIDYIHDVDELLMLIDGIMELKIGNQIFNPEVGQEILIPKGSKHSVKNIGSTTNRWLYGYKMI